MRQRSQTGRLTAENGCGDEPGDCRLLPFISGVERNGVLDVSEGLELGLIGSGIGQSMAPMLHEALGRLTGRDVRYVLHDVPPSGVDTIAGLLDRLRRRGVRGVNITHPFKERAVDLVRVEDPAVRALGAINTVRIMTDRFVGHNTDHSGLVQAYRHRFPDADPGRVAQLGAGGFGRSAAFAMAALGATSLRLYDPDRQRARSLARDVSAATGIPVTVHGSAEQTASGAEGIINCSPIGMHLHPGCPIDPAALAGPRWVFDAVYAPLRTEFLVAAERRGAARMSGSDLFFWQGVHAFEIFTDSSLAPAAVEAAAAVVQAEVEARAQRGA